MASGMPLRATGKAAGAFRGRGFRGKGHCTGFPAVDPARGILERTGDAGCDQPRDVRLSVAQAHPMDQRIEAFLADVLMLAGEPPEAIREGVRVALASAGSRRPGPSMILK